MKRIFQRIFIFLSLLVSNFQIRFTGYDVFLFVWNYKPLMCFCNPFQFNFMYTFIRLDRSNLSVEKNAYQLGLFSILLFTWGNCAVWSANRCLAISVGLSSSPWNTFTILFQSLIHSLCICIQISWGYEGFTRNMKPTKSIVQSKSNFVLCWLHSFHHFGRRIYMEHIFTVEFITILSKITNIRNME